MRIPFLISTAFYPSRGDYNPRIFDLDGLRHIQCTAIENSSAIMCYYKGLPDAEKDDIRFGTKEDRDKCFADMWAALCPAARTQDDGPPPGL